MNNQLPLISVIVPIYDVEQYLRCCLDSLVYQTYSNLEILLVNDGSPDRCDVICKEYAAKDSRIVYIEQTNIGLSGARNTGLEYATGDFILFVDSDDWAATNMVETLVSLALKYNVKFVAGNYDRVKDGKLPNHRIAHTSKIKDFSGPEYVRLMSRPLGAFCFAWNRLIHRSLMKGVTFPVGFIFEDIFTMPAIVYRCDHVIATSEVLYHYRIRNTSLSHRGFSLKALHEMDAYLDLIAHARIWKDRKILLYAASFFVTKYYVYLIKMRNNNHDIKWYKQQYMDALKECWRIIFSLGRRN